MLDELRALYRDVDALYEGARCDVSTECCRFGITGREPQVTSLELALVKHAIKRRGGMISPKKRALPITSAHSESERVCPLLDRAGHCSIYQDRPLGCRTFYCARAQLVVAPARGELKTMVRRLQDLAARHAPSGDKPRALTAALKE